MLIKGQDAKNFRHADTFKVDRFKDQKMRFVIENPPFGTPWSGEDAKEGQEQAVRNEYDKGIDGRWGAGLPGGGDSQMIFLQSAIDKMEDRKGRAAIIENGSPLFKGDTGFGESQIRRWILENDLLEVIIVTSFATPALRPIFGFYRKTKELKEKAKKETSFTIRTPRISKLSIITNRSMIIWREESYLMFLMQKHSLKKRQTPKNL